MTITFHFASRFWGTSAIFRKPLKVNAVCPTLL